MPVLLLLLLAAVVFYLWLARRSSSLTRTCRWRLDRSLGSGTYRCASCGAVCAPGPGAEPRTCLRGRGANEGGPPD